MNSIKVGTILNTHGIHGEMKLMPEGNDLERFQSYDRLFIADNSRAFHLEFARQNRSVYIIKLREFNDINEIIGFKGKDVFIDEEALPPLQDGEYYIHELIGCDVFDKKLGPIGNIIEVLTHTANDVYVIQSNSHGEIMIPAVKEFIRSIDIENRRIEVELIEGMIE